MESSGGLLAAELLSGACPRRRRGTGPSDRAGCLTYQFCSGFARVLKIFAVRCGLLAASVTAYG
jgi:hypothetical protein